MGVPKYKVSKQRRNKRFASTFTISAPNLSECPQCHQLKPNHQVCDNCGFYDGKQVVVDEKETKKK